MTGSSGRAPPRFRLYSRPGCTLCETLVAELSALPRAAGFSIEIVDVDDDPAARIRYGHKIPVLMFADELVCHGRLDLAELDKALAPHRPPV